ncbi:uncharacterized protein LOC131885356 [Tigriopus californicus]|uniref:uncharacterized protein LOC131885356 n=1 Tax=Tigriopus californicus TaxID=6832 RepID=UPI0027D9E91B|nr:uncharacterized protein LOC131885356 [Tigriopus californicus]
MFQSSFGFRNVMGPSYSFVFFLLAMLVCGSLSDSEPDVTENSRQKRLFSLFNIVKFKNKGCTSVGSTNMGGTCLTSTECTSQGGASSGNCAAGFGVCCIFSLSGSCGSGQTVSQNCTYIRNSGFPSADTTASETCTYNFNRICDNLCQIRLDFDSLTSQASATGSCGTEADAITVSSPFSSSSNAFPPTVCGTLTGQHMYLETGTTGNAGTLSFAKGTGAGNRSYQIKVTYFTCDSLAKAPAGCTQYFTGIRGSFQSYNHAGGQLLQSMDYSNCFRQEEGYCQLQIRESLSTTPDAFLVSAPTTKAMTACADLSFITFSTPTLGAFCGGVLNSVNEHIIPGVLTSSPGSNFQVGLNTLAADLTDLIGFNLNYNQVPCA